MANASVSKSKYKSNDLTAEYVRSILDYNPETGIFRWKYRSNICKTWNTNYHGKIAGRSRPNNFGYLQIGINGKTYLNHRLAWIWMTGEWPKEDIDHKDLNKINNKWDNLREATPSQNHINKIPKNAAQFRGVLKIINKHSIKYRAYIRINGIKVHLGLYETPEIAYRVYCDASKKYHGEFGRVK